MVHKRGNIVQSIDYYPFGLTWENPKDDFHTYQGKELQRNEWSSGGLEMLDFHARMYNPLIGRWHNPDPMNQFDSPYNAMGNNPVINIDPDGMWSLPWGGILTGLGNAIFAAGTNTTTSNTFVVSGKTEAVTSSSTTTSAFGKNVGGALQILGGLVAFGQGAKMLSDGLFDSGQNALNSVTPQVYYSYYYDRYGTFIKKEQKENGDAIFIANGDITDVSFNNYHGYRADFVQRYLAVVLGEAGQRADAAGIGAVIMNRFQAKSDQGKPEAMDANWVENMGGATGYVASTLTEPGHGYPDVMSLTVEQLFGEGLAGTRAELFSGALSALSPITLKEINTYLGTPHFWEGIEPYNVARRGAGSWYTRSLDKGIINLVSQAGSSYFFNYSDADKYLKNRKWP